MQTTVKSTAQTIIDLWFARQDVFPFQWFSARRQIGGYAKACQHRPPWVQGTCPERADGVTCAKCPHFAPIPVDENIIARHLAGALTVGSYQLALDGTGVKWACLDFDDNGEGDPRDLQDAAMLAHMALQDFGLPTSIEASGGQGWRCHLWAFFDGLVPAIKARVLLEAALKEAGLSDRRFIERFPKQVRALNGYGNLVKLPFGVHRKTGKRSQFLNPVTLEPIADVADALARVTLIDPANVDFVIDMRHLDVQQLTTCEVAPVSNFDRPPGVMRQVLKGCWYFRELEKEQSGDGQAVHYEDWWTYLLLCCRFGEEGVAQIHTFSERDQRYDQFYTNNLINYARQQGYHMANCSRMKNGPGLIHCPLDPLNCGAPAAIAGFARQTATWQRAIKQAVYQI